MMLLVVAALALPIDTPEKLGTHIAGRSSEQVRHAHMREIYHPEISITHPTAEVFILEVQKEALIESPQLLEQLPADHQARTRHPFHIPNL
jgi:hypothetical protein